VSGEQKLRGERARRRQRGGPPQTRNNDKHDEDALPKRSSPLGQSSGANVSKNGSYRIAAVAGGAVALALGAFMFLGGGPSVDSVSDLERADRNTAYQTLAASGGFGMKLVSADEVEDAIEAMPKTVSTEQREQLKTDINQGRVKLAWLSLWDTHAEDGDILRFESSSSFPVEVMALNAKTTIAIPFPADGNVQVTGVKDGGGGITIALESGATKISWPTMAPGDVLDLPVTPTTRARRFSAISFNDRMQWTCRSKI